MDQRLGRGQRGRRVLRQTKRQFAGRGFQFQRGHDLDDQTPIIGLRRRETVFGEKDL